MVEELAQHLERHPLYGALRTPRDLRLFTEHHVVCVFDFMSLLKRLQAELTCTSSPWTPPPDPVSARLVNELVLDEESDDTFGAEPASHYVWYVEAMEELGANTGPIRELERRLRAGMDPGAAVPGCGLSEAAEDFCFSTFALARGPLHVVASAFVLGRENIIPGMFLPLVRRLRDQGLSCRLFLRYLERHISIDGEDHGPKARAMLERIVGRSRERRDEASDAARLALLARKSLWDAVHTELERARGGRVSNPGSARSGR